ncbi:MAG: TldD/PmbA family protein [Halanaerobiales bacterium]|nr:TldD/PmbA family protein [Halanaerobiales bacterium]
MLKLLEKSLKNGADSAEIFYLEKKLDEVSFTNGELENLSSKNLAGFNLRVKKDGKIGMVSSSNMDRHDEIIKMALDSSTEGDILEYDFSKPTYSSSLPLENDQLWDRSYEEYIADGEKIVKIIKDYDPQISVSCGFRRERETKNYLNTNDCNSKSTTDNLILGADGQLVQNQSILEVGCVRQLKTNDYSVEELANEVIQKIKIGRVESSISPGKMPVILTPNALSQIAFAIVAGLSGENIRLGVSPLKDRIGEQIFDDKITLFDDMTLIGGSESSAIDDEGTPAQKTLLYEKGILKNYLLHLKSAHALGLEPNGKASRRFWWTPRDYAKTPTPWFSNWIMEPGTVAFEEMLADIKEGLIIDSMYGLIMGNLIRGDVDSDIDLAFKVENGKIVGRVKNAAIGVNIYEILKDQVVALGNKLHFASAINSGHMLLPHILLRDINIVV